ncbi:MAG: S6e family ribosomal protein, partial [Candidatus Bathycorpusculaceae bacterium]
MLNRQIFNFHNTAGACSTTAKFKIVISDPETGTSSVTELEEAHALPLIGRKLGEIIDGSIVN